MKKHRLRNKLIITRREFLKVSTSVIAGLSVDPLFAFSQERNPGIRVKFGIVTDSHYADTVPIGNRYFRQSFSKMQECIELMNRLKVDFLIELGDFKDQDTPPNKENTILYLQKIENLFQQFKGPRYHVLGNHDLDSLSKKDFLKIVDNTGIPPLSNYYSFDLNDLHFIVLDANFKKDGTDYRNGNFKWRDTNIPSAEINWLRADLQSSSKPVIVFVHQQLDCHGDLCVNNSEEVREVLQNSRKTIAVFQGHNHMGHYSLLEGIHYFTLKAMVEGSGDRNNAYAVVKVFDDGSMSVTGFRNAISKVLS